MSETHGNRFVLQRVQQRGIAQVELWYQIAGGARSVVHVAASELESIFEDGLVLDHTVNAAGGPLVLVPDAATFVGVAHEPARAGEEGGPGRLICDLQRLDGAPHPLCVRTVLKKALARAAQGGDRFYLGARIAQRWIGPQPLAGGIATRFAGGPALSQVFSQRLGRRMERDGSALRSWALVSGLEHWYFEYNWVDPLTLCDTLATHRVVARLVARDAGHEVTFMRRPWRDAAPSQLDLFLSRDERGGQSWGDPLDAEGLSLEARALSSRLSAGEGPFSLVFRHGVHGRKAQDPISVSALAEGRGLDGAALRIGGLDAAADPYLAAALLMHLALGDNQPAPTPSVGTRDPARVLAPASDRALDDALGTALAATLRHQAAARLEAYWDELTAHELDDELLA